MNNYEYCARWASAHRRVLDYGCGCGELVASLRANAVEAYGCDVFFEGGDFSRLRPDAASYIRRMESDRIPFEDGSFDAVVSNQVLEHVPDLNVVVAELARVLKPGGRCLHLFPHRGVLIEPHTRIPLLHWFPKGARWRLPYAMLMRAAAIEPSRRRIEWVDTWTHYRDLDEIHSALARQFKTVEHIEPEWFSTRFGMPLAPDFLKRWITRCYSGVVLTTA